MHLNGQISLQNLSLSRYLYKETAYFPFKRTDGKERKEKSGTPAPLYDNPD